MISLLEFLKPPKFDDENKDRSARLLNIIQLVTILAVSAQIIVYFLSSPSDSLLDTRFILSGLVIIVVGLNYLMRRGYVRAASLIFVSIWWIALTYLSWNANGLRDSAFVAYIVIIIMASVLIGWRASIIFTMLSIAAGWGFVYLETIGQIVPKIEPPQAAATELTFIYTLIAVLIYLVIENLSKAVQSARQSNQELQTLSNELEKRVREGTRNLDLAAEIGRSSSRIRNLEEMLPKAVTMIQKRFNLYHTQIYLVDETEKSLVMRAGTGAVGEKLKADGHRLPISQTSINGTAVTTRKAVIVEDVRQSANFQPNPLLPETRSEMSVPLIAGETVVGALNLQSKEVNALTTLILPAFEALAGQVAIAVENARLFQEVAQIREEVEARAHSLTREGWQDFLDGIHRSQRTSYRYDNNEVVRIQPNEDVLDEGSMSLPISVTGEPVGLIQVEAKNNELSEVEQDLVSSVANQVGRRIENLRLLAEAQQFRLEAEAAANRVTRESWQAYRDSKSVPGYAYDGGHVQSISGQEEIDAEISAPLDIRGEMIGELHLEGVNLEDENAFYMAGVIADQLSAHIENLRLNNQTELALAESRRQSEELAVINQIANTVAAQLETRSLLDSVLDQLKRVLPTDSFTVALYDRKKNELRFKLVYDAINGYQHDLPPTEVKPVQVSSRIIQNKKPELILFTEEEMEAQRKERPLNLISEDASITASLMFAPMMSGDDVIGVLSLQSYELNAYTQSDLNLITGVASYVTTGIQNAQLFNEIQQQSEKERLINTITQKIQGTMDVEAALQTAVSELGTVLQAQYAQVSLGQSPNRTEKNGEAASATNGSNHA